MKKITVFLSASDLEAKYVKAAKELGKLLVENDYQLVYGGTDKGLMKVMAEAVQKAGGKIVAISTELFRARLRKKVDEAVVTKTLSERKDLLLKRGDGIVLMAGGIGSLDEVFHILELKKHDVHKKPMVVLNTANFYQGLKMQLDRMEKEGFLPKELEELIKFVKTPKEVIAVLNEEVGGD